MSADTPATPSKSDPASLQTVNEGDVVELAYANAQGAFTVSGVVDETKPALDPGRRHRAVFVDGEDGVRYGVNASGVVFSEDHYFGQRGRLEVREKTDDLDAREPTRADDAPFGVTD
ncbi:hypothetical protein [Haloarchaeobius sp. DYHT-AS-18]|uniref:hypothetical protein n=1 Tax=Haloarchaeobius sp. DYHT-AS-18 TaxID=3446117 RepID=UPI003EBD9E2F